MFYVKSRIHYQYKQSLFNFFKLSFGLMSSRRFTTPSGKKATGNFIKLKYPDYSIGPPTPLQENELQLSQQPAARKNETNGSVSKGIAPLFKGWWEYYVRGENPDYPMRRRMFEYLWNRGVNVYKMSYTQIEDWTRWVEVRRQYGIILPKNPRRYPQFPGSVTLEDKLRLLRQSKARRDPAWVQRTLKASAQSSRQPNIVARNSEATPPQNKQS